VKDDFIPFKNHENYNDPTAYFALVNISRNTRKNQNSNKQFHTRNLKTWRKENVK